MVIRGGTAACITASRLAKADPNLRILVIEGGKNNKDDPLVRNPAIFLAHLAPTSQTALFYKANSEKALNDREVIVPMGGLLGGGSSINFMMYTRAQAVDFDSWKTEGWDYKSLLPLLKKLETYHPRGDDINMDLHGTDGPINVSFGTHYQKKAADDVLAAANSIGEKTITDMQDFEAVNGFSPWAKYIGPDGKRQDTAHMYLHPLLDSGKYPNLHLLCESRVDRVLFDENKRASGVVFEANKALQPEIGLSKSPSFTAHAKKLVVVAAGALSTPSVLERSGCGDSKVLQGLGIDVVSDLPDVGEHYQDHHLMLYPYKTSLAPEETNDRLLAGRVDFAEAAGKQDPMLGWNSIDIAAKMRPSDSEVAELGPDFKKLWDEDFANSPTRPLMLCGVVNSFLGDHKILNEEADGVSQYATTGTYTAYPYSRGNIHIQSKDAQTPSSFNTGFLSHEADVTKQIWAYKKQRELYRRTNQYRGELAIGHPAFREGSKAALVDGPAVQGGFKDEAARQALAPIEYDEEDDKAIEKWVRDNISTTWHSCGTTRMAPKEKGGVVDKNLNVYGVTGLKCAGKFDHELPNPFCHELICCRSVHHS